MESGTCPTSLITTAHSRVPGKGWLSWVCCFQNVTLLFPKGERICPGSRGCFPLDHLSSTFALLPARAPTRLPSHSAGGFEGYKVLHAGQEMLGAKCLCFEGVVSLGPSTSSAPRLALSWLGVTPTSTEDQGHGRGGWFPISLAQALLVRMWIPSTSGPRFCLQTQSKCLLLLMWLAPPEPHLLPEPHPTLIIFELELADTPEVLPACGLSH